MRVAAGKPKTLAERQQYIEGLLDTRGIVTVEELARQLGVSRMTVHRDLDRLQATGVVRKARGGALRVDAVSPVAGRDTCSLCHGEISAHGVTLVSARSGQRQHACCMHCGLLLVLHSPADITALTLDFVSHLLVDVRQASYVIGSSITICCSPGLLCFAETGQADRFCNAFGGARIDFEQALSFVQGKHAHGMSH